MFVEPSVSFINILRTNFLYVRTSSIRQLFSTYVRMYVKKRYQKDIRIVQKIRAYNVDEIDTYSQFHEHFTSTFYPLRSQKRDQTDSLTIFFLHFWDLLKSCA